MSAFYKNSLVIDFTVVPVRPKLERVREFVVDQMGIDMSKIKNLQTRIIKAQVIIEVETAELAVELVTTHNLKHSVQHKGKEHYIPIYTPDDIKDVRVFDLPCRMPNNTIVKYLSAYGEVIAIKDDTWKDLFSGLANGTRLVRMKLQKPIPSYVTMSGVMSFITYNGQTRTCKHCAFPLHIGKPCSQNRKDLISSGLTAAQLLQFPALGKHTDKNDAPVEPAAPGEPGTSGESAAPVEPAALDASDTNVVSANDNVGESESTISDEDVLHEDAPMNTGVTSSEDERPNEEHVNVKHLPATQPKLVRHHPLRGGKSYSQSDLGTTSQQNQAHSRDASSESLRERSPTTSAGKRQGSPRQNDPKRKLRQHK